MREQGQKTGRPARAGWKKYNGVKKFFEQNRRPRRARNDAGASWSGFAALAYRLTDLLASAAQIVLYLILDSINSFRSVAMV